MPEMPELENIRKLLSDQIVNLPILNAKVNKEGSINIVADDFASELQDRKVIFVERRGKLLNFHLDNGRRLLVNLMVGGSIFYGNQEDLPSRNTHVEISFGENILFFVLARSGYVHLLSAKEAGEVLAELGMDVWDRRMNIERFIHAVKGRRGALKTLLVNQNVISGIGNRYADEIAFKAGLLPSVKVQELENEALGNLYHAMKSVLSDAVETGGVINVPLMTADSITGHYKLQVYDRAGENCEQCSGSIDRVELNGRKAFFCPICQHE
ncbi:Fpg/Nei family DNA glycosylase [Paenibacillus crassostreae]|uniref:Formamidopyrimidine-DNA glycosylase n=1 Tax=Paenibacillus crassostreae TaxID=1763538 RepID=A0A162KVR9_9BACL|nr:DNA-formamidopyrimidine glycosylase family protein [Paenibacillus crassostreae]AOZ91117.1 endonuclease VIII [Paenibacillus crassostreae]OAB74723.1 formamidopyrimidine-DNA glycosylase [Paenibacillus crassostreae]